MNEDTEVITIDIDEEKLKASVDRVIEESINKDVVVDILPCEEDVIDTFEVLSVKKVEHLRSELEYVITSNNLDEDFLWQDKLKINVEWNGSKCIPLEVGDDQLTLVGLLSY